MIACLGACFACKNVGRVTATDRLDAFAVAHVGIAERAHLQNLSNVFGWSGFMHRESTGLGAMSLKGHVEKSVEKPVFSFDRLGLRAYDRVSSRIHGTIVKRDAADANQRRGARRAS